MMFNQDLSHALSSIKYGESLALVRHLIQQMQNLSSLIFERTWNKYWFGMNFNLMYFNSFL